VKADLLGALGAATGALPPVALLLAGDGIDDLVLGLAEAELLGVLLVELGIIVAVALDVAVARRRRGKHGALALLEAARGYF